MPAPTPSPKALADLRKRRQQRPASSVLDIAPTTKPKPVHHTAPAKSAPHKPAPHKSAPAAPVDPAAAALDRQAAAAVRTRFGGTEKELVGQQRVSDQMQTNVGDWFDQYKADVEKARQRTADVNTGIQVAQAAQAQQAQAADTASAATPEAQQAAASRRSTSDSFGAMLAAQAGSENAYQADKGRIGSGEEVQQHLNEAGRKRSLSDSLADLKGQEGDYAVQYKTDAAAAAQKAALEDAAFGLDQTKEADTASAAKAQRKETVRHNRASEENTKAATKNAASGKYGSGGSGLNKYGYTADEWAALPAKKQADARAGKGTAKKGPSAADKRADQARVDKVRDTSTTALTRLDQAKAIWQAALTETVPTGQKDANGHDVVDKNGVPVTRKATPADAAHALAGKGYTSNEIHLMRLLLEGKKWGPQEIAMAHQLKIKVPRQYIAGDNRKGVTKPLDKKGSGSHSTSKTGAGDFK